MINITKPSQVPHMRITNLAVNQKGEWCPSPDNPYTGRHHVKVAVCTIHRVSSKITKEVLYIYMIMDHLSE